MPGQRGKSRAPGRAEGRVPLAAAAVVALVRGYPLRPLFSQKPSLSSRAQPTCPSDTRYAMHDAPPAVPLRRPPVRLAKGIGSEVHQSRGSPWRRKKGDGTCVARCASVHIAAINYRFGAAASPRQSEPTALLVGPRTRQRFTPVG